MEQDFLSSRREELTGRAKRRGIEWQSRLKGLPKDDDGVIVAALATLLELDVQRVFEPTTLLEDIEQHSHQLRLGELEATSVQEPPGRPKASYS